MASDESLWPVTSAFLFIGGGEFSLFGMELPVVESPTAYQRRETNQHANTSPSKRLIVKGFSPTVKQATAIKPQEVGPISLSIA